MPFLILILLALVLTACDRSASPPESENAFDAMVADGAARYDRQFLFVSADEPPTAAIFEFSTVTGGPRLRRTARGWATHDDGWARFLDAGWLMDPMREPWRLVPHGPLRLVVDDDAEAQAIVHRGERAVRLELDSELSYWTAEPSGQLRIQRARLELEGHAVEGVVLDVHLGRRLEPGEAPAGAVSRAGNTEAFLSDGRGLTIVLLGADAESRQAWVRHRDEDHVWEGARMEALPAGGAPVADHAVGPAGAWRIWTTRGGLHGEVRTLGELTAETGPAGNGEAERLHMVEGWVEVLGARRQVTGIVRRGPE